MRDEAVLALVGSQALKTATGVAVKHYGPPLLKRMDRMIKDWRRASHPSLGAVREICDDLERFLINPSTNRELTKSNLGRYIFQTSNAQEVPFRRMDMTGEQVANLWFRTNTARWKESVASVMDKWNFLTSNKP